jgi:hypothetical protein
MRHSYKFHKKALILACVLGLTAGVSLAQTGDSEGAAEPGGAEAEVRRLADLTDADMLAEAEAIEGRATRLSSRMMRMLDESRQDRDIIRVTCLNAKLTETHATERSIEARATAVRESIASGDTSRRNHEYTVSVRAGSEPEPAGPRGQPVCRLGRLRDGRHASGDRDRGQHAGRRHLRHPGRADAPRAIHSTARQRHHVTE